VKKGFVKTENFKRLAEAHKNVERRGAREASLVIIKGLFGIGKSELTARWAADCGWVFVRAKETWTVRGMLDDLADKMGVSTTGNAKDVQARITGRVAIDMVPIIIDEADFLLRGKGTRTTANMLEAIRDITDVTGVTCFLVGMENFRARVALHPHIESRVAKTVELLPLSLQDVKVTVAAKAEVGMDDDLIAEIHKQAAGRMRLVLGAIANIEQWAQANSWTSVTAAQVKNKALCTEPTGAARLGRPSGVSA
jgi:DNA transposition AAA+ family ATPase